MKKYIFKIVLYIVVIITMGIGVHLTDFDNGIVDRCETPVTFTTSQECYYEMGNAQSFLAIVGIISAVALAFTVREWRKANETIHTR